MWKTKDLYFYGVFNDDSFFSLLMKDVARLSLLLPYTFGVSNLGRIWPIFTPRGEGNCSKYSRLKHYIDFSEYSWFPKGCVLKIFRTPLKYYLKAQFGPNPNLPNVQFIRIKIIVSLCHKYQLVNCICKSLNIPLY